MCRISHRLNQVIENGSKTARNVEKSKMIKKSSEFIRNSQTDRTRDIFKFFSLQKLLEIPNFFYNSSEIKNG